MACLGYAVRLGDLQSPAGLSSLAGSFLPDCCGPNRWRPGAVKSRCLFNDWVSDLNRLVRDVRRWRNAHTRNQRSNQTTLRRVRTVPARRHCLEISMAQSAQCPKGTLEDAAMSPNWFLMIRLVQEPESLPFTAERSEVFGRVDQLSCTYRWISIISGEKAPNVTG